MSSSPTKQSAAGAGNSGGGNNLMNNIDSGLTRQQQIVVGVSCFILVILAIVGFPSSDDQNQLQAQALIRHAREQAAHDDNDAELIDPPSLISSPSSRDAEHNNIQSHNNNNQPPPPQQQESVPSGPTKRPYVQPKRDEPRRFYPGMTFPPGETPMTMLRDKKAPAIKVPEDWDGGYGWVFVEYHPSKWEKDWRAASKPYNCKIHGDPLCNLRSRQFAKENAAYMSQLSRMAPDGGATTKCPGKFPDQPMEFDPAIFSRFEYVYKCTFPPCHSPPPEDGPKVGATKYTYIEPLVGLLRHPLACTHSYPQIINKNYMIHDAWKYVNVGRSSISPEKPRVLYLDGGASTWSSGAGGASQNWFYSIYESMCLAFSDWFMWELAGHDPKKVYSLLPGHIKPGYRWMNIPLTTAADSWDNPINHLLLEGKREDVVVFKIDFDAAKIEEALLLGILDTPEVWPLIDHLYFEHHVKHEILANYWATGNLDKPCHQDSLELFSQLRKRGIHASSWV